MARRRYGTTPDGRLKALSTKDAGVCSIIRAISATRGRTATTVSTRTRPMQPSKWVSMSSAMPSITIWNFRQSLATKTAVDFQERSMQVKLFVLIAGVALISQSRAADDDLLDLPTTKTTGTEEITKGGTIFRFAPLNKPETKLDGHLYWRHLKEYCGVETAPARLLADNKPIFQPEQIVSAYGTKTVCPIEGRKDLPEGDHILIPG